MADDYTVPASELLGMLRGKLEILERTGAELRCRLEAVDGEQVRIAAFVSVLDEFLAAPSQPAPSESADVPSSSTAESPQPPASVPGGLKPAGQSSPSRMDRRESGDQGSLPGRPASVPADTVASPAVDDDADRPLRHRVRDAVAAGIGTRKELTAYFRARGVEASAVDDAVTGLRSSGVFSRRLPRGHVGLAAQGGS